MKGDARTRAGHVGKISDVARVVINDGDLDRALRVFKKQTERAGVFRLLKDREAFTPRSARRRAKSLRARKRNAKAAAKTSQRDDA